MLEEDWDEFPQILREMLVAGLVVRRDDGTYALTILGLLEVETAIRSNIKTEWQNQTRSGGLIIPHKSRARTRHIPICHSTRVMGRRREA
jgi:hypothetical protein